MPKPSILVAVAASIAVLAPAAPVRAAMEGHGTLAGTGTITPGLLPATAAPQAVSFGGTLVGALAGVSKGIPPTTAGADAGALACAFTGGTIGLATSLLGQGTLGGGCGGVGGRGVVVDVDCPAVAYERVGSVVVLQASGHPRTTVDSTGALVVLPSMKCVITTTDPLLGVVVQAVSVYGVLGFVPTSANPTTSYVAMGQLQTSSTNTGL